MLIYAVWYLLTFLTKTLSVYCAFTFVCTGLNKKPILSKLPRLQIDIDISLSHFQKNFLSHGHSEFLCWVTNQVYSSGIIKFTWFSTIDACQNIFHSYLQNSAYKPKYPNRATTLDKIEIKPISEWMHHERKSSKVKSTNSILFNYLIYSKKKSVFIQSFWYIQWKLHFKRNSSEKMNYLYIWKFLSIFWLKILCSLLFNVVSSQSENGEEAYLQWLKYWIDSIVKVENRKLIWVKKFLYGRPGQLDQ